MKKYNEDLNWRYATKKFDADKKLSPEELDALLESIQLTASSYGLQPYEVLVIEDLAIRENLKEVSWNQSQLTDASHVIVFANYKKITQKHIDSYLENIRKTRELKVTDLEGLKEMLSNTILSLSPEAQSTWAAKQTYIALGNLLSAAANLKIDTCPMEGFDAAQYDDILGLTDKGLTTAVIATIGFRSAEDKLQYAAKVRKDKEELFHLI